MAKSWFFWWIFSSYLRPRDLHWISSQCSLIIRGRSLTHWIVWNGFFIWKQTDASYPRNKSTGWTGYALAIKWTSKCSLSLSKPVKDLYEVQHLYTHLVNACIAGMFSQQKFIILVHKHLNTAVWHGIRLHVG